MIEGLGAGDCGHKVETEGVREPEEGRLDMSTDCVVRMTEKEGMRQKLEKNMQTYGVVGVVLIVSSFALHSSYPDLETTTCSVGLAEVGIVCLDIYLLSSSSVG